MQRGVFVKSLINYYEKILKFLEKFLPFLAVGFFLLGIFLASRSESFAGGVENVISLLISYYGYLAPIAIYLILTPSLIKILNPGTNQNGKEKKFISYAVKWLSLRRLLACLWAAVFTSLVFGLPLYVNGNVSLGEAILKTLTPFVWMLTHSSYFYALYLSILTVLLSYKFNWISSVLSRFATGLEACGRHFMLLIPFFMLGIGSYVYYLPTALHRQISENLAQGVVLPHLNTLSVLGFAIHADTSQGMILAYLAGAFLTGLACILWHLSLLLITKWRIPNFSIIGYFKNYWIKVYPLLWATSCESLSTPLNLHLIKTYYPQIKEKIRMFIVGSGSFLNINGTLICVFVLAGVVTGLMGIKISLLQLLIAVPLICFLGYGVPGIPGELILFAGPLAVLFGLPEAVIPVFLALYIGLQIGLPDSFRTGNNSTDNAVYAILLDRIYQEKFEAKPEKVQTAVEQSPSFIPSEKPVQQKII